MHINYMGDDEIVHPEDLAFPHVPDDNYGAESDDLTVGPAKKFKLTTLPLWTFNSDLSNGISLYIFRD